MIERAEAWLGQRGVTRVVAPFNGAGILGLGVLTTAFDEEPVFPFRWNPPYYAGYFTEAGYAPTYPLWYYTVDFSSDRYRGAERRVAEIKNVRVRPINKKQWNQDLETFRILFNESFKEEWEFAPLTSEEFHEFFDEVKPMLDPRQMLIGEVKGEPAGFCLGFPDWTPLFRSFNGKMGIVQIIRFMLGAKAIQESWADYHWCASRDQGKRPGSCPRGGPVWQIPGAWSQGGVLLPCKRGKHAVQEVC